MKKMFNLKIISLEVKNELLATIKKALLDFVKGSWHNSESDLQRLNEQVFIKDQAIDNYFPQQINLGGKAGVLEIEANKKVYNYEQVEQIVEHIKENRELYYNKKEKNYDFKEIKSKLKLSRDQILYFIALVEEPSLLRIGYRKEFYLIPVAFAADVQSIFTGKKNIAGFSKEIDEQVFAGNAIKEIKQQLSTRLKSQEERDSFFDLQAQESETRSFSLNEEENVQVAVSKKEQPATTDFKKTAVRQAPKQSEPREVKPTSLKKDPFVEKLVGFLSRTGEGLKELRKALATSPINEPVSLKKESISDQEFFSLAASDFHNVDVEDFFKPSSQNIELSRLDIFASDFKNFTLRTGISRGENLRLKTDLTNALFSQLKRAVALVFDRESFRVKKIESSIEVLLAFNDPTLAAAMADLITGKIGLVINILKQEDRVSTEQAELIELKNELILLHRLIVYNFKDTFTHQHLAKSGRLFDRRS